MGIDLIDGAEANQRDDALALLEQVRSERREAEVRRKAMERFESVRLRRAGKAAEPLAPLQPAERVRKAPWPERVAGGIERAVSGFAEPVAGAIESDISILMVYMEGRRRRESVRLGQQKRRGRCKNGEA